MAVPMITAIERVKPNGPTFNQIEAFYKALPLDMRELVQFTVSEDDEICLTIFKSGRRFEALFDIDSEDGLHVTWLKSQKSENSKIIGSSFCVNRHPDILDTFRNTVVSWFK